MIKYKSKFEQNIAKENRNVEGILYEPYKIEFIWPAQRSFYVPDWVLPNGIIVESKGRFTAHDRKKHLCIRDSNPELDIRFLFQRANERLRKDSKTTYGDWCTRNGFIWAEGTEIPKEWLKE